MASNNDPPPGSENYSSGSRWRHQESSRYARHAGVNAPPTESREADEHESVDGLAAFLNESRISAAGTPLGARLPLAAGAAPAVASQPIVTDEDGRGNNTNEGTADANMAGSGGPATDVNRDAIERHAGSLGGITDGKEVRCGPLLNYRRMEGNRWFGSVLIVTRGGEVNEEHGNWVPELILKRVASREPAQSASTTTPATSAGPPSQDQANAMGPESPGADAKVRGSLLYADSRNRFWRFSMDLEMEGLETQWAYEIPGLRFVTAGKTDKQSFFVPSIHESMRIMFHSCNGFSVGTDEEAWSGAALWNDVQRVHRETPFHVMIGGGDQIYNDGIRVHGPLRPWTNISNPLKRRAYPFPESLRKACDDYYASNYVRWYSTEPFAGANGQIPQLNLWDDHDIIDGFGSYVDRFMKCDVFRGIGGTAYKYYLLFQHHLPPPISTYTTDAPQTMVNDGSGVGEDKAQTRNTYVLQDEEEHPSYIIGKEPGPYVAEHSRSIITRLGARIAFFGLDARTERTRHQVNHPDTYQKVFDRISSELAEAAASNSPIQHLVVLLGIPIAYPRLSWLENIFSSPLMAPIKFLNKRFGLGGSFINRFDGGVDLLDDLDDHYTAAKHKRERHELVKMLQDIAVTYSVRVTILSGDVHLAAVGRFYSNPRLNIPVEKDHRYISNIVSSAIVNKPPPAAVANFLARRNKIHHLDTETDETLMKLFDREPGEGSKKAASNKVTMPSRNWAMITECSASISRVNAANNGTVFPPNSTNGPVDSTPLSAAPNSLSVNATDNRPHSATPGVRHCWDKKYNKNAGHGPLGQGEFDAGTTNRAADLRTHGLSGDGALDIAIRVEKDQHDRNGMTQPYGLFIPTLNTGRAVPTRPVMRDWKAAFARHQIHRDVLKKEVEKL